jgi:hypothetical protein
MLHGPGLGYWPDPRDARDLPLSALGFSSAPPRYMLEERCVSIPAQGGTSSCVGQAVRQGFGIEEARWDANREAVAALGIYFNARAEHGMEAYDAGTFLRTGIKSLVRFGPLRERDWPFDASKVNRRPSWNAYRRAHDGKGPRGYYRIDSTGDARLREIQSAIAAEHPVVFGTTVTETFMPHEGGALIERPPSGDPVVGGHAMCVVGYDADMYRIANSWGTSWRDGGFAWLRESYLTWEDTRDLWVIVLR